MAYLPTFMVGFNGKGYLQGNIMNLGHIKTTSFVGYSIVKRIPELQNLSGMFSDVRWRVAVARGCQSYPGSVNFPRPFTTICLGVGGMLWKSHGKHSQTVKHTHNCLGVWANNSHVDLLRVGEKGFTCFRKW